MTYTVVALLKRKDGMTPAEFRTHYDTVHVPLLRSLVGSTFPLSHTRNYVTRNPTGNPSPSGDVKQDDFLPVVYMGQASDVNFDSVTVLVWEDKSAFDRFQQVFSTEEVYGRISEDEKNFLNPNLRLAYAIDKPVVTNRG